MIVEFIGTPGSGKTTLVPTVIECLHHRNRQGWSVSTAARPFACRTLIGKAVNRLAPVAWRERLLWQIFYHFSTVYELKFCMQHPRLIWQVVRSQQQRPAAADIRQRRVLHWFFRLTGYYEFLKARIQPDEVLILDEGFLHRVVQMNASGVEEPDPDRIITYVDLLPKPDLVIFTQAPQEICEQRLYKRGLWERFRRKSPDEISHFVGNAHQVVSITVDHIKARGWAVLEVNNGSASPEVAKAELRRKLAVALADV